MSSTSPTPATLQHTNDEGRSAFLRLGLLVLFVVGAAIAVAIIGPGQVGDWIETAADSTWGMPAFIAVYAVTVVFMVPGTINTLIAGAVFGFPQGFLAATVGASIGAILAFLVGRVLGQDAASRLLGTRFQRVDHWFEKNDFLSVLILRLMPIFPFNAVNYAIGLTSVRLSRYAVATVVGIMPAVAVSTFAASRANEPNSPAFIAAASVFVAMVVGSGFAARRMQARRQETTR